LSLVLLISITGSACSALNSAKRKEVTEGLTLYETSEPLAGKLLFLVSTSPNPIAEPRREDAASVYEVTLADLVIRKVTSAPNGEFISSARGDSFVVQWPEYNRAASTHAIRAWGYSLPKHQSRSTTLYSDVNMPGSTVVIGNSAFFDVWSRPAGPGILRFNFDTGEKSFLDIPRGDAPAPHQAEDSANVLHVQGAWDSWYGYDVLTGHIGPVRCVKGVRGRHEFRCADGGYVFFEGSEAPIHGLRLVHSPADSIDTKNGKVARNEVRVLKRFSWFSGGYYSLNQLSPCGRYALVCHNEPIFDGWAHTYYVVNVATGNLSVLMKDDVTRKAGGSVSWVWWLKSE